MRDRLLLLLAYLALPIDLVPDVIPVLAYADDAIVIGVVLRSVIRRAGPDVVRRHWPGSDDGLALLGQLCRIPHLSPAEHSSPNTPDTLDPKWGQSGLTFRTGFS